MTKSPFCFSHWWWRLYWATWLEGEANMTLSKKPERDCDSVEVCLYNRGWNDAIDASSFTQPAEQPAEQSAEPVGVVEYLMVSNDGWLSKLPPGTKLYTAPQPAKQPLTDDDIDVLWAKQQTKPFKTHAEDRMAFARAIIAAYDAKNGITGETK